MNTEKLMEARLEAMDLDIKQILELVLSVHAEREFVSRLLYMNEKKKQGGKKAGHRNFSRK